VKIVVFGSTGGVGQHVVQLAHEAGHQVTAFLRTPEKLRYSTGVAIRQGDAFDEQAVAEAIHGQDAVISCLSSSAPLKASDEVERMTRNVVSGMQAAGIDRIGYCASAGVDRELPGAIGKFVEWMLRHPLDDHRRAIGSIIAAGLNWTIARPTALTNGMLELDYQESLTGVPDKPRAISRASVAHFLVRALGEPSAYDRTSVGLALARK
jgi:uncharacterized protein YbjT (DUF2867 family)